MSGGGGFISNMQSSLRNNKNQLRDRKESSYRKLKLNLEGKAWERTFRGRKTQTQGKSGIEKKTKE